MIKEQEQTAHFDEAAWVAHVAATRARLYKAFGLVPRSTEFDTEYYQPTEAEIGRVREAHAVIQRLNQLGAPAMI